MADALTPPCNGCIKRHRKCHSECAEYREYSVLREKYRNDMHKLNNDEYYTRCSSENRHKIMVVKRLKRGRKLY